MAKLNQKFHKGSKSKLNSEFADDFQDLDQQSRGKKKRRVTRSRFDSPEYSDFDY
ncbi:hypothetical protein [Photobacterium phosphoreum]|uniref:hypothetical protein n=1 Tax=Photobacterium phosphoreum TaxID=659 RepID=UPI0015E6DF1C|nr:hypothetical protein [Photobacterium phosphoreum]